jgi:hypothetical protein
MGGRRACGVDERVPVRAPAHQRDDRVARPVDGRLVARVKQQNARTDQLVLGQRLTAVFHLRKRGDQVVGRLRPACGDDLAHEGTERDDRGVGGALLFLGVAHFVHLHDRRRPRAQAGAMLRADAEQFTDEDDGQRLGKVVDEIEGLAQRQLVERRLDDRRDAFTQTLNPPRCEGLPDQTAQSRVLRWFVGKQMVRFEAVEVGLPWIRRRPAEFVA